MVLAPSIPLPVTCALHVKVHQSENEVEELRAFWTETQKHPNSDLDHFLLVCRLRPEVIGCFVFSLWQQGSCVAVVAGRIGYLELQPRIGYLKLPCVRGRMLTIIHEGVLGQLCSSGASAVVVRIKQLLSDRVVDMASFNGLMEGSPLLDSIRGIGGCTLGAINPHWAEHRELKLASQPGFLVQAMKSKHRSWIRKKTTDLERAAKGKIAWRWHDRIGDVVSLCHQMEAVAARTYQRGLGAGFKDDEEHRERLALFARQGTLRVLLLEVDGQPAAFWYGISYRGVFHSEATGYIAELQEHEVGTQIFLRLIDELVSEGVGRFDFGLGDAHYKQRFGDRSWRETTVRLFGNTWRSQMLRAYVGSCEVVDRTLRSLVQRVGLSDRLKQAWRRRLAVRTDSFPAAP
jgi:hypothetical protein